MTDYKKLVEALRYCAESGDFKCGKDCPMHTEYPNCLTKMDTDAADAIEALQAENADIREELFISQRKYDEFTTIASMQNAMLAKQLPKRGEWVRVSDATWQCTVCGGVSCCDADYCPDCGAKMEVQDG